MARFSPYLSKNRNKGPLWWTLPFGNECAYIFLLRLWDCDSVLFRIFSKSFTNNFVLEHGCPIYRPTYCCWGDRTFFFQISCQRDDSLLDNQCHFQMQFLQQLAKGSQIKTWALFPFESHFEPFFSEQWLWVVLKYLISLDFPKLH